MNALVPVTGAPMMTIPEVERVALALAKGGLFGSTDPNAVLTLCLLAQAEGQHPAVVFRDYHIIQGKPAKKADAMLRDFVSAGGKVEWHALDDTKADATFSHTGGGTVRIDWTMQRAQQAGLSTPMWKKYPRQMLRSRVISEGVRTVCPGATSGLYEVGEVQDIVAERPAQTQAAEPEAITQPERQERRRPDRLEGPIKTRKALRIACGEFVSELHACADEDTLEGFLATDDAVALVEQVKAEHPFFWDGDGADFLGLAKEIERRRELIAMDANAGERQPIFAAG
jgi:hypothetical protein